MSSIKSDIEKEFQNKGLCWICGNSIPEKRRKRHFYCSFQCGGVWNLPEVQRELQMHNLPIIKTIPKLLSPIYRKPYTKNM